MGPRAFNRVCASIRINRDYDVVSVRINAHGVTKRAWAFNCETTVILMFGTAQAVVIRGVSLFQGCTYFRGVLISGVYLFQGCPYFRGSL